MDSKTCCVTGHRDIPASKINAVKYSLYREIQAAIADGYTRYLYRLQARSRNVTLCCSAYYTLKGNEVHIPDTKHIATYGSSAAKILR